MTVHFRIPKRSKLRILAQNFSELIYFKCKKLFWETLYIPISSRVFEPLITPCTNQMQTISAIGSRVLEPLITPCTNQMQTINVNRCFLIQGLSNTVISKSKGKVDSYDEFVLRGCFLWMKLSCFKI